MNYGPPRPRVESDGTFHQIYYDKSALKYWAKEARRAEQWLRAPAKNKPKSERSIRKWSMRLELAQAQVTHYTIRILSR